MTKKATHPERALEAAAETVGRTLGRTTAVLADHLPWTRGSDGLDLLERDHRRLEALLKQAVETDAAPLTDRKAILEQFATELLAHEQIEAKVLYPVLKSHAEAKDIVLEGYQEHHVADVLMEELQELPPSDERWGAKLEVLQESLEHHIEEEEGEMFKTARSVMSPEQLADVGARMEAMKEELAGRTSP
ncbi:MAG: hemerythrin domain-containing protein [Vicinamibacterales bacterium]